MSVLILAMIQDQAALVASKHYLVETEDKSSVDPPCTPVDKNVATTIYKKVVVAIILSPGLSTTATST